MGRAENDLQYAEKGLIMQSNLGITYDPGNSYSILAEICLDPDDIGETGLSQ